jgi:hypothetical protein
VQPRAIAVASVIAAVLWAAPWPRALASAPQVPVFHGGVDLVHLGVTVTDR